jgi:hypothetical protein
LKKLQEFGELLKTKNKSIACVLVLLFLSIYTSGSPHFGYFLPFHADEWDNIKIAQEILKEQKLIDYNPFLQGNPYYVNFNEEAHGVTNTSSSRWELNYNLFIALSTLFTGIPALEIGVLLPVFLTFIMSFNTFILVRYLTKKDIPALLSGIFVMTLKSNVTFLGPWFLVASSFGLAFIPLIIYLFLRSMNSKKYFVFFLAVFTVTTLAHPASTIIFLPIFCLYLLFNPGIIEKNRNMFFISILLLAALLLTFLPFEGSIGGYFEKIFKILLFPRSTPINGFVTVMQFPEYMGILAFALSIYGFSKTIQDKETQILPLSVDALLPIILAYIFIGYAFLATYERVVLYISEFLMILAGIGLYQIYIKIKNRNIAMILVAAVLIFQVHSTFDHKEEIPLIMGPQEYSPILWLKYNTPPDAVILATPRSSEAIGVIADRDVISLMRGRLGASEERINKTLDFYSGTPELKEKILLELRPDYVYSREEIRVDSLKLVYKENNIYIYEVK